MTTMVSIQHISPAWLPERGWINRPSRGDIRRGFDYADHS